MLGGSANTSLTRSHILLKNHVGASCGRPSLEERRFQKMLYSILCYHAEDVVGGWTKEEDDAVMANLAAVQERLMREGKFRHSVRLLPTTAATTLRKDREPALVLDGPFAETKEQLLGFYVIDCASLDEALDVARQLGRVNPGGAYEIRPIGYFLSGEGST
jgi:hypothetical protein